MLPAPSVKACSGAVPINLSGGPIFRSAAYTGSLGLAQELALPAPQPTCVAFGGLEGNLMFVTSARAARFRAIKRAPEIRQPLYFQRRHLRFA